VTHNLQKNALRPVFISETVSADSSTRNAVIQLTDTGRYFIFYSVVSYSSHVAIFLLTYLRFHLFFLHKIWPLHFCVSIIFLSVEMRCETCYSLKSFAFPRAPVTLRRYTASQVRLAWWQVSALKVAVSTMRSTINRQPPSSSYYTWTVICLCTLHAGEVQERDLEDGRLLKHM
jgi:hypothetical protein